MKESTCSGGLGDPGLIPGLRRTPGEGNGNSVQYSCLGDAMEKGAGWAIVSGVTKVRHELVTKPSPLQKIIFNMINTDHNMIVINHNGKE